MLLQGERLEPISRDFSVIVSKNHSFNTDTVLLASFSKPKRGETCADFGTGCGTIPIIWCVKSCPNKIYAVEIQEDACKMAQRTMKYNNLTDTIKIVNEDIRNLKNSRILPANSFDLIACNPPYKEIGTGIQNPENAHRIARHETMCNFEDIVKSAAYLLRFGGRFCFCLRPERLASVIVSLKSAGLEPKRLRFVQQRQSKSPFLFLMQANKGGRPGLNVDPVLFIEDNNGGFSEEMKQIYGEYAENKGVTK